jgi:rubredoxin
MDMYRCKVCGYVYIPKNGEIRTNTMPNTAFEDLSEDWSCPKCGAGKIRFIVTQKPW